MWRRSNEEKQQVTHVASSSFLLTQPRVCLYELDWCVLPAAPIETVYSSRPRRKVVHISASAGDPALPFYPNVISDKYENSYVAAVYMSGLFDISPKRLIERRSVRNRGWTQVENMTSKLCCYPTAHANNVVSHRSSNWTLFWQIKKNPPSRSICSSLFGLQLCFFFLHSFEFLDVIISSFNFVITLSFSPESLSRFCSFTFSSSPSLALRASRPHYLPTFYLFIQFRSWQCYLLPKLLFFLLDLNFNWKLS